MEYYLCVLDFEATCWDTTSSKDKSQMEIIEFPSVLYKIDEVTSTQTFISEFAKYVKPTINQTLSTFCTELTGITQSVVNSAQTFIHVYREHIKWIESNVPANATLIFATCGHWDLRTQLPRELQNKKCKKHSYYLKYINVKDEFENFYRTKAGGMTGMLDKLGLKLDGRHHSGIDDTKNIAKIAIHLINAGLTFDNYTIIQLD